tara:strand:+ start:4704 stop:5738 length:1035 start_codon:yes stop_codon:yes gene_type:complete
MSNEEEEVINDEVEVSEDETPSLRDSLEAAVDEHEDGGEDTFDEPMHKEEAPKIEDEVAASPTEAVEDTPAPTNGTEKPPLDWGPGVREEWKKLPDSVKKHLHERDQHVNTMLQDGAQHRKMGENFINLAAPYKAIMQAEGVNNPLQAVDGLFKTVGTLRMGSQADKAQQIANLVQVYGVDINALDNALVGNPQAAEVDPVEAMIDQRMAPVNDLLGQINQNRASAEQAEQGRINEDIGQFSQTAEFFEDVRNDMADFMDVAAKNNIPLTLKQAYDKACAMNPEISSLVSRRTSDKNLLSNSKTMARKTNAASSIRSRPSGGMTNAGSDSSIRGALLNAFEEHA